MVRPAQVGRSRGCQACRTRRIKCDLNQPQCRRCLESGRDCPGPLTGVLVIQTEQTASGKMVGKLLSPSNFQVQRALPTAARPQSLALVRPPSPQKLAEDNVLSRFLEFFAARARRSSWTLKLPQLKNDPGAHALRSSLRAVSLAYFAHVTQDRAVQVESLRHYGHSLARQRSALTRLPSFLHILPSSNGTLGIDAAATTNALLATVILSYFELICPSGLAQHSPSSTAWISHTLASERLIAMLGPESVSSDIIGQLFYSIRSHAVHRAAVLGHYTVFSEKEWLEAAASHVPKQSYARSAYDRVTEWILRLSRLRWTTRRDKIVGVHEPVLERALDADADSPESLLEELKRRYGTFLRVCRRVSVEEVPLFQPKSTKSSNSQSTGLSPFDGRSLRTDQHPTDDLGTCEDILMQEQPTLIYCMTTGVLAEGPADLSDLHPKLQKLFAAMTTAYFHAAAILLQTYFPEVTRDSSNTAQIEDLAPLSSEDFQGGNSNRKSVLSDAVWDTLYNARIIIAAGKYLQPEGRSNGTAVLRMMLPFSVLWHFCRNHDEGHVELGGPGDRRDRSAGGEARLVRLEAKKVFAEWCKREGMSGLVAVGFAER